jgi:hypothetical protein
VIEKEKVEKLPRRHEAWRVHVHQDLVKQLYPICARLQVTRRAFMDDLVAFAIAAANESMGQVTVLEMLQEAARKEETA